MKIDAQKKYDDMVNSGRMCHGVISSLAVLYVVDLVYQKYNPEREYRNILIDHTNVSVNQEFFVKDIVSACAAIFIHNLPNECFVSARIDRLKAPLAFLLNLSDTLQQWERPSLDNPEGLPATQFNIVINHGKLTFHADVEEDRKEETRRRIKTTLIAEDVEIQ